MALMHQSLAESGRWFTFSIFEQLGHVGSEVDRALHWKTKGDTISAERAIDRGLELIDFTLADPRWIQQAGKMKELARAREVLCDYFYGDNVYNTTADFLKTYFLTFALGIRKNL